MKSLTMNLILVTAASLVASTAASAQSLNAQIPFAFRADKTVLAPGAYRVIVHAGQFWFELRSMDSGASVMLPAGVPETPPKEWEASGHGLLEFACAGQSCALRRVWEPGNGARRLAVPKEETGKQARLAIIPLTASAD